MFATKAQIKDLDRLQKRSDFLSIQGGGQKWISKSLILQVADNGDKGQRFGLTVSKKISKSAVVRNRIKRRLRAAARDVLPQKARQNADYVLIGRGDAATKPYTEIVNDLAWCVRKIGYQSENKAE
ncbi:MAG: ribonuclease P protein component [Alphaproteobacteria bacterium]|nr:ribonuclease P protein component [Alphaproteobacteria bacterium]